ncbi:hypothetical protein TWF569_000912 [Orbilia oligospora]|uniref:Ribosomal RNA-processing protein 17 n=1 Tax=Orbilia oligospora TaxID=2813651 RepID=A0A7C8J6U5_ORBOL|nr:hypothetical protein TWF102_001503 [Orbilia oligospora]KAF3099847.1 hypothetical protein TWF103_008649 [Orbilia oligospora]KAF3154076.1 hypothetical protein TWF569_000912 [Orbilia oligospora]
MPKPYSKPGAPSLASKKRKRDDKKDNQIDEITFDRSARQEYLTGFHKRKVARIKAAQEEAEKRSRQERVEERKRLREARKEELRLHVEAVNQSLGLNRSDGEEEDEEEGSGTDNEGAGGTEAANGINEESEFVDEEKFTTVTVTTMDDDEDEDEENEEGEEGPAGDEKNTTDTNKSKEGTKDKKGKERKPKQKKKKFRYLSKSERKDDRLRDKVRRSRKKTERTAK